MRLSKIALYPFSVLYDAVTRLRNHLYDIRYKPVIHFETVVISIGNLSVGGTGKTPLVEYLVEMLKQEFKIATLSRGYGRKTTGFRIIGHDDNAETAGDEPFQFYRKFGKELMVTVGEERAIAIPQILFHREDTEVILLDDAYQHRKVERDLNILLTPYGTPFFKDYVLPAGRLREARGGAARADIIIVTKCPAGVTAEERKYFADEIATYAGKEKPVFFSSVQYESPIPVYDSSISASPGEAIIISGLANSAPFEAYARKNFVVKRHFRFGDHHHYTLPEVMQIRNAFEGLVGSQNILLTTEKDMVKFLNNKFRAVLGELPFFYIPIKSHILFENEVFQELITNSIRKRKDCLKGII